MSEEELSLQCQRGDTKACRLLYERYGGQLMAICLRYTGNRENAEDVLHDGFLRIYQSIGQFVYQGNGSLKAWLSKVMVNEALGYLRKHNAQIQQEVLVDEIPDSPDDDDGAVDDIPQSVLMQLISELPDGYRSVFNLYVFENKSHKEIASLLGITEHTSSSQFYRAKNLLIKKINEYRRSKE
ncbi:sigma-70 family RNA polymerase sigma factor [uncultured Bacteroides sp.]|uniref:RNA polymerase sigma factor n=1 Tax=uncultured Bacteroides sp. TaxID=162156 RepID=UPI00260C9732|nr:sigma-70 family RNA polymerase sigma factor [uncultured Bacteroides sp.]